MPNRLIKESIRTSRKINGLSDFEFRLWVYLITYVDDFGRGSADPELLKGFVFPRRKRVSETDIEKTLAALADSGCIHLYAVDGESYFCFPNWSDHQRIQTKQSKFPEPPPFTAVHREPPSSTVNHRDSPLESNPIQYESESNPNTKGSSASRTAHTRKKHGQYGWVLLTEQDHQSLLKDLGQAELDRCITYVDELAQQSGNKYRWKDWNLVIRKAHREGWGLGNRKQGQEAPKETSYDLDEIDKLIMMQHHK